MRNPPTCPRCGGQLRAPGLWSSAWTCARHGTVHPYNVLQHSGQEAIEQFRVHRPHVTLMDLQMPRMDGFAATRTIRAIEDTQRLAATPSVVLSANARPEDVDLSREAGCNSHLSKPISKVRLLAGIAEFGAR